MVKTTLTMMCVLLLACGGTASVEPQEEPCDEPEKPRQADAESRIDVSAGARHTPCPMVVDTLSPRAVPAPHGGLILASGCGFSGLRDVKVHPDAVGQAEWISVPFSVIDDSHVLFFSGTAPAAQLADVYFIHETRQVQRYFGFVGGDQ